MRVVIQRVSKASVRIESAEKAAIGRGLMILLGIEENDTEEKVHYLCGKISKLRIFDDTDGVMNRSVKDIDGEILLVSQFTLYAETRKGNRPSYIRAARPEKAIPLYELFISVLEKECEKKIQTGTFGALMQVSLVNDGPVTIWMED